MSWSHDYWTELAEAEELERTDAARAEQAPEASPSLLRRSRPKPGKGAVCGTCGRLHFFLEGGECVRDKHRARPRRRAA